MYATITVYLHSFFTKEMKIKEQIYAVYRIYYRISKVNWEQLGAIGNRLKRGKSKTKPYRILDE